MINTLPDYPAIKKLASALHKFDTSHHGTAIMIGAGFSRSAAHHVSGKKKMPLWDGFTKKLAQELNPSGDGLSFSDPLRVAEEYRAYFGQAALNDRIRSEIDDEAWEAGELYKLLLELPWSEVVTTNWDSLLERAATNIHSPYYTPVTKPSDLAWAPSPRIVKLHGTIGITDTLIAAQEDYRTYPAQFAPFVNFVRQVFIENELCLLGFSGDDPNFLQWAGWVRDHLAGHARKIYLVGALNLTPARRKHMESINVVPIDLWDAVQSIEDRDRRHQKATELFLQAMWEEDKLKKKPHEWAPTELHRSHSTEYDHVRALKEPEYGAIFLKAQLETLKNDRESYPGWLVCPPALQWQLESQLCCPFPTKKNVAALSLDDRAKLLYEVAWRHSVTGEYIAPWLADALFEIANSDAHCNISKRQKSEISLVLLQNSRWLTDDNTRKKQATQSTIGLFEKYINHLPDGAAELAYHKALVARDSLDYSGMEAVIKEISGEDPAWKLRQATLLIDLGRLVEGAQIIAEAYGQLRRSYRSDRHSISILSRLTWAHWLLKRVHKGLPDETTEQLPVFAESIYRKWNCDPWTWIENIREKANKRQEEYQKSKNPIEPSFEQGHYRENSNDRSSTAEISEILKLDMLSRNVGIPLHLSGEIFSVNLLGDVAQKFLISGGTDLKLWDYSLAIRAARDENSSSIKNIFTRIGVACMPKEIVDALVDRMLMLIDYRRKLRSHGTNEQKIYALSALRAPMEVLARLTIRVPPEKAKEIFILSVSLGCQKEFQHHWLFDVMRSLQTHSFKSIPKSKQGDLLKDVLAFPLQNQVMNSDFPKLPNPIVEHPYERSAYANIENLIDSLINSVSKLGTASSTAALLRLIPLSIKKGFLTEPERKKLAAEIWGTSPTFNVLPNIGLLPHALLRLPVPNEEKARTLICQELYEHEEGILTETEKELRSYPSPEINRAVTIYQGIANAAADKMVRLFPTPQQSLKLFDRMITWRPKILGDDFLGNIKHDENRLVQSICNALSNAIVPSLNIDAKTPERFHQLKKFYDEIDNSFFIIPAFVWFTPINGEIALTVEKIIQRSLHARGADEVSLAALALTKWAKLPEEGISPSLNRLISRLITIIESGRTVGLQQLLWTAGVLLKSSLFSQEQIAVLTEALQNAFNTADYSNIEPISQEAVRASSIREECVRLANALLNLKPTETSLQDLLNKAKIDALPEVRFAITEDETQTNVT